MAASMWKTIPCKIAELRLDRTLACGQSFRWKEYTPGIWTGVIGDAVWQLKQTDTHICYTVHRHVCVKDDKTSIVKHEIKCVEEPTELKLDNLVNQGKKNRSGGRLKPECLKVKIEPEDNLDIKTKDVKAIHNNMTDFVKGYSEDEQILTDYFQLNVQLEELYESWSKVDKHFQNVSKDFAGIRMLRQDPVECLFSFICSSNNHISRISGMVEKLAIHFGRKINLPYCIEDKDFYMFPEISALAADGVEEKLRGLGFGYRAKYIQQSARYIQENGGETWLYQLRHMEYSDAKKQLIKLCGVGAKVADCVLLMCLDKPGSIPVDTHVWQIAARDYMPKLTQAKSLTDKLYDEIGDFFRDLWGPYAGWAHSVLFTADLKQFKQKTEQNTKMPTKRKVEAVVKAGGKNNSRVKNARKNSQ